MHTILAFSVRTGEMEFKMRISTVPSVILNSGRSQFYEDRRLETNKATRLQRLRIRSQKRRAVDKGMPYRIRKVRNTYNNEIYILQ